MPFYFYTPIYEGPQGPTLTDPETGIEYSPDSGKSPGKDEGSGVEWVEPYSGMTVLKRDEAESRFVLKMATRPAVPGWVEKSSAEVLADYPDLPGVN